MELAAGSVPDWRWTDLEQDDAGGEQLLADVELELGDADILEEEIRQGVAAGNEQSGSWTGRGWN